MMYSAYKLNKQGDNIQPWHTHFPIWNQSVVPCPVLTVASWPAYRFLKRQVRWSGIPISLRIFHSWLWSALAHKIGNWRSVNAVGQFQDCLQQGLQEMRQSQLTAAHFPCVDVFLSPAFVWTYLTAWQLWHVRMRLMPLLQVIIRLPIKTRIVASSGLRMLHLFVVVQSLSLVQLFATLQTVVHQAPLSCTLGVCSHSCWLSRWCHPTSSSSVAYFSSCLQSFPASGSFPMRQLFTSDGQNIGASASALVLPMNIPGWFPLGLTGLIYTYYLNLILR